MVNGKCVEGDDGMNNPIEVTNGDWLEVTHKVEKNTEDVEEHEKRLNRHRDELNDLRKAQIELPLAIQKAVENGLNPVLEKLLSYEKKFTDLEIRRLQEQADRAKAMDDEKKDRNRYFRRTIFGAIVTAAISGVVGFYVAVFLNNL